MLTACPHCRKPIVVREPGIHDCPRCQARIWIYPENSGKPDRVLIGPEINHPERKPPEPEAPDAAPPTARMPQGDWTPPWEERAKIGVFRALAATWKLATLHPTHFFTAMRADAPIKGVVFYGWIVLTVSYLFWAVYRLLFIPVMVAAMRQAAPIGEAVPSEVDLLRVTLAVLAAAPLLALLTIYINALLYFGILRFLGAPKGSWRGTLRVVAYAESPMLFLAFPFFGELLAFVWNVTLNALGLARVHGVGPGKSLLAVFLPPLTFYFFVLVVVRLVTGSNSLPFVLP
ncbi:MAG: YIP1 family protein [Myxococcales bacterium]|nr:MAG: YIP1 family protein [Myxococcales bacterium]